ncbi:MAG: conjugative transfer ATPase, partial [Candidatus Competibacteraceae bacterium]|nr:conjugative transfer ATPase [Candidatus Competibacteraceae bacterium]
MIRRLLGLIPQVAPLPVSPAPTPSPLQNQEALSDPPPVRGQRPARETPLRREHAALYWRPDAFTDLLPWLDYDPASQAFLLEDGYSVGALFELRPVSAEARPEAFMTALHHQVQGALCTAVPEEQQAPWIVQCFVQDEPSLGRLGREIAAYGASRGGGGSAFAHHWFQVLQAHLRDIGRPGGLFQDDLVTGNRWRGQLRRVRVCLYRRHDEQSRARLRLIDPRLELQGVAHKFSAALEAVGVRVRRLTAADLHDWLVPWFNPAPSFAAGPEELLELAPWPGEGPERPWGRDLAALLTFSLPRADLQEGLWWFDDRPHTVVTVQELRATPRIGHLTAEHRQGDHLFALFDRVPEGTIMALTVIVQPQDRIQAQLERLRQAARGDNAEAEAACEQAMVASRQIERGNKLYPTVLAFYLRGDDGADLEQRRTRLNALLINNGLQPIARDSDLLALDGYIRHLPLAYDATVDRVSHRSRLLYASQIAALLPVYGRATGTGHPGCVLFNRGAEPLLFDPLEDRKKNAHLFIVGPPGAGKSAYLVYQLLQTLAVHRPRVFIVDAGNSFGLLLQHLEAHGLTVNRVALDPGSGTRLPPFAAALGLLTPHPGRRLELDETT